MVRQGKGMDGEGGTVRCGAESHGGNIQKLDGCTDGRTDGVFGLVGLLMIHIYPSLHVDSLLSTKDHPPSL